MFDIIGIVGKVSHMTTVLNSLRIAIWRRTQVAKQNEGVGQLLCETQPQRK